MKQMYKSINSNNHLLKISSLIFGYLFWLILSSSQNVNKRFDIPLCFYSLKDNLEIIAPEKIIITVNAKRSDIYNFDLKQAAIANIDASQIQQAGQQQIEIKETDIFLHNRIKLINYYPSTLSIQIKEKK